MKVIKKYLLFIAIMMCITVIFTAINYNRANDAHQGKDLDWFILESPPENATEIIAPVTIETLSRNIYHYKFEYYEWDHCIEKCWLEGSGEDYITQDLLPISTCGWYPNTDEFIDNLAICLPWGPGFYKMAWAIDGDGNVWMWEKAMGEGGGIVVFLTLIGTPIFTITVGGVIIAIVAIIEGIYSVYKHNGLNEQYINNEAIYKITKISQFILIITFGSILIIMNEDTFSSLFIIFFCLTPLPVIGTIIGLFIKNRENIILGISSTIIMLLFWARGIYIALV